MYGTRLRLLVTGTVDVLRPETDVSTHQMKIVEKKRNARLSERLPHAIGRFEFGRNEPTNRHVCGSESQRKGAIEQFTRGGVLPFQMVTIECSKCRMLGTDRLSSAGTNYTIGRSLFRNI